MQRDRASTSLQSPVNEELRDSATTGVKWTALSSAACAGLQVAQVLVLARILAPADFGQVAMVMVLIGFGQVFGQMGLVQAVIQRPEPAEPELVSLYWLNWAASGIVFVIVVLAAPAAAGFYGVPEVRWLLVATAAVFVIQPFGDLYRGLLEKHLTFRPLAVVEIVSAALTLAVAVAAALAGQRAWALVQGYIVGSAARSIGFHMAGRRFFAPRRHFSWAELDGYLGFGLYRVGAMCLNFFNSRVDQLIIGALLGPQTLGYYAMAFNLVMRPIQQINPILTRVGFPVLARIQNDDSRVQRIYFRMLQIVSSINAPILLGVAALARPGVLLILGERWLPMVPVLQLLSLYALVRAVGNVGGSMVLAKGRADMEFRWNALLAVLVPAVVVAAAYSGGLVPVALSLLLLQIVFFFLWYALLVRPLLGRCLLAYTGSVARPLLSAAIPAFVLTSWQVHGLNLEKPWLFLLAGILALLAYAMFYLLFSRSRDRKELAALLSRYRAS